jgi:hypothetical protein
MVIMGVPMDYEDMDGLLEEWIDTNFSNDGVSTIAGRRCPPLALNLKISFLYDVLG